MTILLAADYSDNQWINLIVIGLIAGSLLAALRGGKGFTVIGNWLVGIIGAILGAAIYEFALARFISLERLGTFTLKLDQLVIALAGAFLFLLVLGFLNRKKKK